MSSDTRENPEKSARQIIDQRLTRLGWSVLDALPQDANQKLSPCAVREYSTGAGPADYALFVNGLLLGIIEAKQISINAKSALEQAKRYSRGSFEGMGNWRGYRTPFLYSSNGELAYFLDVREETHIARQIQDFHTPQALLELFRRDAAQSRLWLQDRPIESNRRLRPYQVEALAAIEKAMTEGKRELLVAMATGTGKTFTTVSGLYRLLASQGFRRTLIL
jgi:type I restriction enzyme R subunit